jgi:hypothetical protein
MERITHESQRDVSQYCKLYNLDEKKGTRSSVEPTVVSMKVDAQAGAGAGKGLAEEEKSTGFQGGQEAEGAVTPRKEKRELAADEDGDTVFAQGMQDITQGIVEQYAANDILTMILETVYRGLRKSGLKRTVLFVKSHELPVMDARLAFGDSLAELKTWFSIPMAHGEDIFNVALKQEKIIFIKDSEKYNQTGFFPPQYSQNVKHPFFLILIPILVKGKPICMIYVEGERDAFNISNAHFNYLRILQHQAVTAISQKARV